MFNISLIFNIKLMLNTRPILKTKLISDITLLIFYHQSKVLCIFESKGLDYLLTNFFPNK